MKAIILAAGRGSRMQAMTDDRPKCLVEVRNKPLLDWQLDALRQAGISDIAIVTGYKREMLADRGLVAFHNPRWVETNMVASLACAEAWLAAGPCIVSYSDIFYQPAAPQSLMHAQAALAVTYDPNWLTLWTRRFGDALLDAETFRFDAAMALTEIGHRPKTVAEVQGQYMGLLRFTPDGWQEVKRLRAALSPEASDRLQMTHLLDLVVQAGRFPVNVVPYDGLWGEVDTADDLATYLDA
jgi:choline kinase